MRLQYMPITDATQPAEGKRLVISDVAMRLKVSQRDISSATDISKTTLLRIYFNEWPARASRPELEAKLIAFFERAGATQEEIQTLFHARLANKPRPQRNQEDDTMLPIKATLTRDAQIKFETLTNPFDGRVEEQNQMFNSGETRLAHEAAWQTAINARLTLIKGESGSGKTTVLENLLERIETEGKSVIVIQPSVLGMEESDHKGRRLKSQDIVVAIIRTFDPTGAMPVGMELKSRKARTLLQDSARAGNSHLLLIEEAHGLSTETLRHMKRLHEYAVLGRRTLLGILLLAHPEIEHKLRQFNLRELSQRLEQIELQPLGNADLKAYLQTRVKRAGKPLDHYIDDTAIDELRSALTVIPGGVRQEPVSMLYPQAINNVMTSAMNVAARIGAPRVTRDVIRAMQLKGGR